MGDYLNQLTSRVSGTQAAVRPRLPSLFEPPRGLAATRVSSLFPAQPQPREEAPLVEDLSTRSTLSDQRPQIRAAYEKPASASRLITLSQHEPKPDKPALPHPAFVPSAMERPPIVRARPTRESLRHEERTERGERDDAAREPLRPATPSLPLNNSEEPNSVARRETNKLVVRRPDPEVTGRETLSLSSAPQRRRTEAAREFTPAQQQHATEKPLTPPAPARPAEGVHAVTNFNPARAARETPVIARTEPLEDSSPSVQVVIGRVIVQAIAPPPALAPPAPRPQTPRLSLEEYLKQREGRA